MNKTIQLFLFVVLTLTSLQSFVPGEENRPQVEVVQLKLEKNGELYITRQQITRLKEVLIDKSGNPIMEMTMTSQGPVQTPKYRTNEVPLSVTTWLSSAKGTIKFLDRTGKQLEHQETLQKFAKETAAVYLHASYEDVKHYMPLFNTETIFVMPGPNVIRGPNAWLFNSPNSSP